MNILGSTTALRNIWTDHQIRQALFPSRRSPHDNEEDDDDYQMFMISECSKLESSRSQEERGASSRPCSWHLGLMQEDNANNSYCKIVRRASSVGENKSRSCNLRSRQNNSSHQLSHCEILSKSEQKFTSLGSSEELTIDDIEHVYDNISYDDLKQMGLTRREESDYLQNNARRDTVHQSKVNSDVRTVKGHEKAKNASVPNREKAMYRRGTPNSSSQELRIIDENIYDSICLPEQSMEHIQRNSQSKSNNFLSLDGGFQCFDHLDHFVSEESLQFSEDESLDHRVPSGDDYIHLLNSSSKSSSAPHKTAADKLSEEVDEIWNDLENYIKKNEEKKSDRLLASFPVSKDDVREKRHIVSRSHFSKESQFSISSLCVPPNSSLPRTAVSNSPSVRKDDPSPPTSPSSSLLSLKRTSLTSEMTYMESPIFSSQSTLSYTDSMTAAQGLDSIEKSKNKVVLMARQYSQKIKKANQLLKIKSPEQEQPSCKSHKLKSKDLAAIMEEKKQGGSAIGKMQWGLEYLLL